MDAEHPQPSADPERGIKPPLEKGTAAGTGGDRRQSPRRTVQDVLRSDLIARLTGLTVRLTLHAPEAESLPDGLPDRCPLIRSDQPRKRRGFSPDCAACCERHWRIHREGGIVKHAFTGRCGVTSFLATVFDQDVVLGRFVLQARLRRPGHQQPRSSPPRRPAPRRVSSLVPVCSAREFGHAILLLSDLLRHLEAMLRLRATERERDHLRCRLRDLQHEDARLRRELRGRVPGLPGPPRPAANTRRHERIVQRVIDYLNHHFTRPVTLAEIARTLGMNACYLSTVFSRTTGMRFHSYLDELRMNKARELLRDPLKRVGEVATSVGYSSEHYFREAFRRRTGLSPSAWREGGLGAP